MSNPQPTSLIDTHCHLDFPEFDLDRSQVIARCRQEGLSFIINVGASVAGSERSVVLARENPCVYATVGIHPHEADSVTAADITRLRELCGEAKVTAIGEAGLDFFKNYSSQDNQRKLFQAQITLAQELNKPLVLHSREAQNEILAMLRPALPLKAVVHCFSGDELFLDACLKLGFLVSFTCNVTYKKAQNLREMVKRVPLERLMLETDAPHLPPEGCRGQRNEPSYVKMLAEYIAQLKGLSFERVSQQTTQNAREFFNLP